MVKEYKPTPPDFAYPNDPSDPKSAPSMAVAKAVVRQLVQEESKTTPSPYATRANWKNVSK